MKPMLVVMIASPQFIEDMLERTSDSEGDAGIAQLVFEEDNFREHLSVAGREALSAWKEIENETGYTHSQTKH